MASPVTHRLQVLAAALLFSTGGAVIKATSLTGWQVAGLRSAFAALALAIALPSWRRCWRPEALLVGAAYAATLVMFVTSNKLTTAANAIFLQATAPLYLLVLAPRLLGERILWRDLAFALPIGLGLGLFFVGVDVPSGTAPAPAHGNAVAAVSGATWALTLLGLRWLGRRPAPSGTDPAGAAVLAGNLIAMLVCLPFALPIRAVGPPDLAAVAWLGLFQIGLAYVCLTRGVRHLAAFEVSLLLLLEPVLNALGAWALHGERPGPWSLAGCGLILAATTARTLTTEAGRARRVG